jgi:hypothetical protein
MIAQGIAQPIGLFASPTEAEWSYSAFQGMLYSNME